MRRIVIANRKGGCGKTTIAVNISVALGELGKKVLVVDLDPQSHATFYLGENPYERSKNLYEIVKRVDEGKKISVSDYIKKTKFKNIELISSSVFLSDIDYNSIDNLEEVLMELFYSIDRNFDFIFYDTSPSVDKLTISGFIASEEVVIPVEMHYLSLQGLAHLVREIYRVNKKYRKNLRISAVVPTLFNQRTRVYRAVLEELKKIFPEDIIYPGIRYDIKLAEAPSHNQPIIHYAPISRATYDFKVFARKFLRGKASFEIADK